MTVAWPGLAAAALLMVLVSDAPPVRAQGAPGTPPTPAARVGDDVITLEELEQACARSSRASRSSATRSSRRGSTSSSASGCSRRRRSGAACPVEDLLKTEVHAKAPEVTDADVTEFMSQNRARCPGATRRS